MSRSNAALFQKSLLTWYRKSARNLPWRRTKDPYKIWVSEIMLQQTQVQTVIPYYEKWLRRFPDIYNLAKAPESEVLRYWAGLGYYRRARMLHQAAQFIVGQYGGKMPADHEKLLKLPGIGRYTAGAIASIAFDQKLPILDGNVMRILARIYAVKDDIGKPAAIQKLWKISESLLPEKNPGDFNQAMMELGAMVCMPQNPQCPACPVKNSCGAFALKKQEKFPVKIKKEPLKKIKTAALILRRNGKVLVEKQPREARWGGLWMFPHGKNQKELLEKFGLAAEDTRHQLTLYHGFTKYKVRLDVYSVILRPRSLRSVQAPDDKNRETRDDNFKWAGVKELGQMAFPSPHRKISESLYPRLTPSTKRERKQEEV